MGGIFILFLVAAYIWGGSRIVGLIASRMGKLFAIAILVLVPTADALYGRIKLRSMCESEGGLKIYKVVKDVEGFYVSHTPDAVWVTAYGYKFSEGKGPDGRLIRIEKGEDGGVREDRNSTKKSEYAYEVSETSARWGFTSATQKVRNIKSGEVFSKSTNISYEGGWVERFIASVYAAKGYAGSCQEDGKRITSNQLIRETLIPAKQ